jgi:hypothetical protein
MDLNTYNYLLCLKTPDFEGKKWVKRTKKEKNAALKNCNKNDTKELFDGICEKCHIKTRTLVEKDPSNPHYGCTEKCCPLLYQWNMCTYCIQDTHFPVVQDEETRHAEVVTFQRVFSKLPEDTQHYISEYVPHIFAYVKSLNTLTHGHLLCSLEKQPKLPKSTWDLVKEKMYNSYSFDGYSLTSRSTRKQIYERVRYQYKRAYNTQFTQLEENDFWTHRQFPKIFINIELLEMLEKVQPILHI